jgi:ABC-2 type transport system ATP-binding protein
MSAPAVQASNAAKRFGRVQALSGVSFSVQPQTITAFLGENGAGKTTAIKLVLGFLRPDSGRIGCRGGRIGYVPERPAFFPWLRGRDIITTTGRAYGVGAEDLAGKIAAMSARIGFETNLLERRVPGYSLGNQKKLAFLQNLILAPDILIADEPFSSLDPPAIRGVRELFVEMRGEGKTLLLSSHLIGEMERICDRFIILKRGRVVIEDDLARLRDNFRFIRPPAGRLRLKAPLHEDECVPPLWSRPTPAGVVALAEKSEAARLAREAPGSARVKLEEPTLESLYFFFTS